MYATGTSMAQHNRRADSLPGFRELFPDYVVGSGLGTDAYSSSSKSTLKPIQSARDQSRTDALDPVATRSSTKASGVSVSTTWESSNTNSHIIVSRSGSANVSQHSTGAIDESSTQKIPALTASEGNSEHKPTNGYPCAICGRPCHSAYRPSSLATHMNTHTGERPYGCPYPGCSRNYGSRSNMQRHYRTAHSDADYTLCYSIAYQRHERCKFASLS